jgi:hypothetical protein
MNTPIRDGSLKIVAYHETFSPTREILRSNTGKILGRFEIDTGITRDATGKITGRRGVNQLMKLLK